MWTDDAVSSSAAAAPNWELPCRESWDRVSEGEWLGDDMSSQFPAQSSSLQNFNLLSFPPPFDLAPQRFFNSLQTFLKNPLSYCTLTVLVVFNKESSASNNSWVQPFCLTPLQSFLEQFVVVRFFKNSSLLCVLQFLGTTRPSVLGNLWYGSETTL